VTKNPRLPPCAFHPKRARERTGDSDHFSSCVIGRDQGPSRTKRVLQIQPLEPPAVRLARQVLSAKPDNLVQIFVQIRLPYSYGHFFLTVRLAKRGDEVRHRIVQP